jgi:hypothetical protein
MSAGCTKVIITFKENVPLLADFLRRTRAVEDVSAFIMFPSEQGVHVLFTRKLDPEDFGNLSLLNKFFRTALGIKREQYFCFVDGPR